MPIKIVIINISRKLTGKFLIISILLLLHFIELGAGLSQPCRQDQHCLFITDQSQLRCLKNSSSILAQQGEVIGLNCNLVVLQPSSLYSIYLSRKTNNNNNSEFYSPTTKPIKSVKKNNNYFTVNTVISLELNFSVPNLTSTTLNQFSNLQYLKLYRVDHINYNAFLNLRFLKDLEIHNTTGEALPEFFQLKRDSVNSSKEIGLNFWVDCIACDEQRTEIILLLPQKQSSMSGTTLTSQYTNVQLISCHFNPSSSICRRLFNNTTANSPHRPCSSSTTTSDDYNIKAALLSLSVWCFVLTCCVIILLIYILTKCRKSSGALSVIYDSPVRNNQPPYLTQYSPIAKHQHYHKAKTIYGVTRF